MARRRCGCGAAGTTRWWKRRSEAGTMQMNVAAVQMTSGPDVAANLTQARALLEEAAGRGARLAALPQNFSFMGLKDADKRAVAEPDGSGPAQDFLAASARRLRLWIVGGTVPLRAGADGRVAAASLVYDSDGMRVARYDKIHLFDVDIPGRAESYRESSHVAPGSRAALLDTPVGRLGLSVCYDVRFPELYRYLSAQGATAGGSVRFHQSHRPRALGNFAACAGHRESLLCCGAGPVG